ncbi:MAG: hypothetical protein R6X21_01750 [Candidatus Aminicenantes bacterium]
MLCSLARRAISRSEDRGERMPRWAERHAARCGACREYARFTASLKARLSAEKEGFLAAVPDFPLNEASWARAAGGGERRGLFGLRPALRPWPAAAAALTVLAAALVLFQVVLKGPSPAAEGRPAALPSLKAITAAAEGLPTVVANAESSLDKERRILEKSIASAFEYLQAQLNIRIERGDRPNPL